MAHARSTLRGSTALTSFAHLLGIPSAKAAKRRAEDKDEREEMEEEEDDKKAARAEDDDADMKAEEVDDDGETEDDEEVEDDVENKKGKNGKKAKSKAKAEDDEWCEEEKDEDEAVSAAASAGRAFERARCKAIFASKAAGQRPDLAAHLAFHTDLSARAARELLTATAAGDRPAAAADRRREPRPRLDLGDGGAAPAATGPAGTAAQIIAAGKKRRGEK